MSRHRTHLLIYRNSFWVVVTFFEIQYGRNKLLFFVYSVHKQPVQKQQEYHLRRTKAKHSWTTLPKRAVPRNWSVLSLPRLGNAFHVLCVQRVWLIPRTGLWTRSDLQSFLLRLCSNYYIFCSSGHPYQFYARIKRKKNVFEFQTQ